MQQETLLKLCNKQISLIGNKAMVSLVMPGKWDKTNEHKLCPGGPIGLIVSNNFDGSGIIVLFNAIEVKRFLSTGKHKVITL